MNELMHLPGASFLKYTNEENEIEGCVFLDKREGKLYLGMLSVSPVLQTKGIGKLIMAAAEQSALQQNCLAIFMRVISIRNELIAWYERQGYYKTGEVQPFDDTKFGTASQPIEFVVMQKNIISSK
jgi:GNAT superfamily N-acetyltransferase